MIREANGIEHRLTKSNHPWSERDQRAVQRSAVPRNGQVERMNRTIKDATTKRYRCDDHERSAGISSVSATPTTTPAA